MCMIFANSRPGTIYHNLMIDFGISGAIIFVSCICAVIFIKPLNRDVCYNQTPINRQNRQILHPILNREPREIIVISAGNYQEFHKQIDPVLAVANYIQNTIPDEQEAADDIIIAEPINQV